MKFNQISKKEQEIRNYLLVEAFGSFCEIGLYTSVVKTTPEKAIDFMSMNPREVLLTDKFTSHIYWIS
ncbi:hypothetical protein [Aquimarina sp. RZ0]|uniref:hypothetical protein n=1 Tax=Aquimarina sp. RZ0 TaxID=2607730 RepID=UPI0011F0EEE2|nr:hypothetical protein [Aquimarina sp. RZ0]KAA1246813.1 hypothetical protein F0000_06020 [Aquimarina sp. RZ0]